MRIHTLIITHTFFSTFVVCIYLLVRARPMHAAASCGLVEEKRRSRVLHQQAARTGEHMLRWLRASLDLARAYAKFLCHSARMFEYRCVLVARERMYNFLLPLIMSPPGILLRLLIFLIIIDICSYF